MEIIAWAILIVFGVLAGPPLLTLCLDPVCHVASYKELWLTGVLWIFILTSLVLICATLALAILIVFGN